MVICMVCKKNSATIHLTDIVGGKKNEVHLCEECAQQQGISYKTSAAALPELLAFISGAGEGEESEFADLTCPECGMTYTEFRRTGRLGCPNDYGAFREGLIPILERVHGGTEHTGRAPGRVSKPDSGKTLRLIQLKRELQEAVGEELYEKAVGLRDEISRLERGSDD